MTHPLTIANAKAYCRKLIEGAAIEDAVHTLDGGFPVVNVRFRLLNSDGAHQLWTLTVWVETNGQLYGEW